LKFRYVTPSIAYALLIFSHLSSDDLLNHSNVCPCIRLSIQCQHFQNSPKAPRPLGRRWWNLARTFYRSDDTTSRKRIFEFRPLHHTGPTYPGRDR